MSIVKIIFLSIIAIVIFQFIQTSNNEYDGSSSLPIDTKIVAFGDSITYGYKVDIEDNYPSQLSELLQTEVINAGANGENSAQGLRRLPSVLDKYKPQILIIAEGGNDITRGYDLIKTSENISKMIEIAKKRKIYVLLVGIPKIDIISLKTADLYYQISKNYDIPLEDSALEKVLNDFDLKIDQIHPNKKGYKILSNKIAKLLTQTYFPSY